MAANAAQNALQSRYVGAYVMQNLQIVTFCRSGFSAVSGCAAGILGLTGWQGFVFYVITAAIMSALIWLLKAHGQPLRYFHTQKQVLWDGVLGGMLSYVLFWTLLYGMVHVYD